MSTHTGLSSALSIGLALTTFLCASFSIPVVVADADCDILNVTKCADISKTCYVDGIGAEICDQCVNGTIQSLADEDECVPIANLTIDAFIDKFNVAFLLENVTTAERQKLLTKTAEFISNHNSKKPRPLFFLGTNKFSADHPYETGYRNGHRQNYEGDATFSTEQTSVPESIDWVEKGAVTYVKDQGHCGCCWACATAGVIEGAVAVDTNFAFRDESLSFQQLISCEKNDDGCGGGTVYNALSYAEGTDNDLGGMTSNNEYGFLDKSGTTTEQCDADEKTLVVVVKDTVPVNTHIQSCSSGESRVECLKQALSQQPVTVTMDASCSQIQHYTGGIITEDCADCPGPKCEIDHAVLAVGYGVADGTAFWKIKNSWGTDWGEEGYFRVAQEGGGEWGLFGVTGENMFPNYATNKTAEDPDDTTSAAMPATKGHKVSSIIASILVSVVTWIEL